MYMWKLFWNNECAKVFNGGMGEKCRVFSMFFYNYSTCIFKLAFFSFQNFKDFSLLFAYGIFLLIKNCNLFNGNVIRGNLLKHCRNCRRLNSTLSAVIPIFCFEKYRCIIRCIRLTWYSDLGWSLVCNAAILCVCVCV